MTVAAMTSTVTEAMASVPPLLPGTWRDGMIHLGPARLDLLAAACAGHEHGGISEDPTIGCCWDADRLELSRLGSRPVARLLSTKAARNTELQADAWRRGLEQRVEIADVTEWSLERNFPATDEAAAIP
jgi:hypothetical protein